KSGTGKSHILQALTLRGCEQQLLVRYTSCVDLLDDLYAGLADGTYLPLSIIWPSVIGEETPDVPEAPRAAGGPDGEATDLHEEGARRGTGGRSRAGGQRGGEEAWHPADDPDPVGQERGRSTRGCGERAAGAESQDGHVQGRSATPAREGAP